MSKIMEMLRAAENGNSVDFAYCSRNAIPDIKRIVEWIEKQPHGMLCLKDKHERTIYGVMAGGYPDDRKVPHDGSCTCGLSEIQSLIRR